MKTLLISNVFPPQIGGSGRWLWELYRRMPREEVVMAVGEHPRQADFDSQHCVDSQHNTNIVRLPLAFSDLGMIGWSGMRGYVGLYRRLSKLIRQQRVDQIHCGTILPEGWLGWMLSRRFGIPFFCFVHGEETSVVLQSRQMTWMSRRVLNGAKCVIVNSQNTARVLNQQWQVPHSRLRMMHPGVDANRFVPAPRSASVREQLGWGNRTVVLTVGRLQERKGQDHLILALKQIRQAVPDVLYAICGDGERRGYLEQLVRENQLESHVQFRGDVADDELIRCYQQCDLFALPNRDVAGDFEGFGMVLVESQACGRPVLAGTSGGTAETMRVNETGQLVNCNTPEPLAQVAIEMLSDREQLERMGAAARHWAESQFNWDALSRQAAEVFRTAMLSGNQTPSTSSIQPADAVENPSQGEAQSVDVRREVMAG